ncbi:hypothetical protein FGO68_gene7599 [Halteria grandinella]|uniref:Uncharacterized protein n=1 Tax=Halteria grandinella TaxID=5974 RepID=A0A8J8NJD2_HALGN|nr:hypothetical protein FGO68_gene7599 [Halteria grandinella]
MGNIALPPLIFKKAETNSGPRHKKLKKKSFNHHEIRHLIEKFVIEQHYQTNSQRLFPEPQYEARPSSNPLQSYKNSQNNLETLQKEI